MIAGRHADACLAWWFRRWVLPRLVARSPYDFVPALAMESVVAVLADVELEQLAVRSCPWPQGVA